jgi:hypothetical protein
MKFLFENIKTGEKRYSDEYIRKDYKEKPEGKQNPDLRIYVLIDNIPSYNPSFETISKLDIRKTKENYEGLKHLLIAYQDYNVIPIDVESIVNELTTSLGMYLDINYPVYLRDKHVREMVFSKSNTERMNFIKQLDAWIDECRLLRDLKEENIRQGQRVDINDWPVKPVENIRNKQK